MKIQNMFRVTVSCTVSCTVSTRAQVDPGPSRTGPKSGWAQVDPCPSRTFEAVWSQWGWKVPGPKSDGPKSGRAQV